MSLLHPIRDPVEGTAHVVGVSAVDPQFMRQPCTMQLVVQAAGIDAFPLRQDFEIWTNQWPDSGDLLPVTFDREHHDRIQIHWDRIPTSSDVAAQDAQVLADQLNSGGAVPPSGGDPLDRIAKLAELHKEGALTDAEFSSEKAKILGSS